MARLKTPTLTEAELKIMEVIWKAGEGTVNDVLQSHSGDRKLAYNTILTTMRILEEKKYLTRIKRGRAHVYQPAVNRSQARGSAIRHVLRNFFDNSPEALMVSLLKNEDLTSDEKERLQELIDQAGNTSSETDSNSFGGERRT